MDAGAIRSRGGLGSSKRPRRRANISGTCSDNFDATRVNAFLDAAPRMVAFFERHTALKFELATRSATSMATFPARALEVGLSSRRPLTRASWASWSIVYVGRCARRPSWA